MSRQPLNTHGFTLFELLVGMVLLGVVFAGSTSVYLSSLKFMKTAQSTDVSTMPAVSVEGISKVISLGNDASLSQGNTQLDVRADYPAGSDFNTTLNNTPANTGDDGYWHYRFINNSLVWLSNNAAATALTAADTVLIPSVNTASSTFQITNPSASGGATVVSIHVVTNAPVATLDTNVALGAKSKN